MEQLLATQSQAAAGVELTHALADQESTVEHGTLMLDRMGRILSCGKPVERLFGAGQARLMGRQISDFIAGVLLGGSSPSYRARYLVYLCADGGWRRFEAMDVHGHAVAVEVNVSQMIANGQEIFLLALRRPAAAS